MRHLRLWPVDWLHLAFFTAQAALTCAVWSELPHAAAWLAFDVAAVVLLAFAIRFGADRSPRAPGLIRLVHGYLVIPFAFTQVGFLIRALDLGDHARDLERLDRNLFFGVNPIEALERIASPWLTEIMQGAYTIYLLLPVVAVIVVIRHGSPAFVARSTFALLAVFYLSYVGYYLVPATGPNIHHNLPAYGDYTSPRLDLYHFTTNLPGTAFTRALRTWMWEVEATKKDCFPSGHVAIAVACWMICRELSRKVGWVMLVAAAGVTFSTVYLRYHYVVDVIAGIALAIFCMTLLPAWHRRFEPVLFSPSPPDP